MNNVSCLPSSSILLAISIRPKVECAVSVVAVYSTIITLTKVEFVCLKWYPRTVLNHTLLVVLVEFLLLIVKPCSCHITTLCRHIDVWRNASINIHMHSWVLLGPKPRMAVLAKARSNLPDRPALTLDGSRWTASRNGRGRSVGYPLASRLGGSQGRLDAVAKSKASVPAGNRTPIIHPVA
jgi:hypothetical protein